MKSSPKIKMALVVCVFLIIAVPLLTLWAQTDNVPSNNASPTALPAASQVAVTVNGTPITEADLLPRIHQELASFNLGGRSLPPAVMEQLIPRVRTKVLEKMIAEQLMLEAVSNEKIQVTEEDVLAEISRFIHDNNIAVDLETFKTMAAARGQDFDEIKTKVKRGLSIQQLLRAHVDGQIDVNDADTQAYYQEHTDEFVIPEQIKASHILISTESEDPNADPNAIKAQAKAKADDLLKQLKAGADFAELARANSACSSAQDGGELPKMIQRGKTVPPFEEAAFALEIGQLSDVVETQYGYHIIKVSQHDQSKQQTYEEAQQVIQAQLEQEQAKTFTQTYINSLKDKAKIVYPETADEEK